MPKFIPLPLALLAFAGLLGQSSSAQAAEYRKVVTEEYVTVLVTKSVTCTTTVVRYDHCGKPYTATVTNWHDVQVPVRTCITVVKWVKVCD